MKKIFKSKKSKRIVTWILASLLLIGGVFGATALFRNAKSETKEINPSYAVGALNTSTGKYVESKQAMYTKEAFECQGLTITLDFDSTMKYRVFFYNDTDIFIHESGVLSGSFMPTSVPPLAKYARVMLMPDDEDISFFDKFNYAKEVTIKVNKVQDFKGAGADLFVQELNEDYPDGYFYSYKDGKTISQDSNCFVSTLIDCSTKNDLVVVSVKDVPNDGVLGIYLYKEDGSFVKYVSLAAGDGDVIYSVSTGDFYYTYKISSDIASFRLCSGKQYQPQIYLY